MADPKFYQCEVCGNVVYQACEGGGTMVTCGTPEEVAAVEESYTGKYLKKYLNPDLPQAR